MANQFRSKKRCRGSHIANGKSRVTVRQFDTTFELLGSSSSKSLEILKHLGAGNTASKVADMVRPNGCSKSTVSYNKDKWIAAGALRLKTSDVIKFYELTPYGSKILARSEGSLTEVVVLEDFAFKYRILQEEALRVDWRKLGSPRNWLQLGVQIDNVQVEKTSRHIIIHPGKLRGFDPKELEYDAVRIVERVRGVLEGKFGMILSDDGVRLHEPIFRFYSEEAKEDVKHATTIVEGVGSIDNSPPERIPHEEYSGVERARARLLLPDLVKVLTDKVDRIEGAVGTLDLELGHVVKALEKLGELPDSIEKLIALLKGGGDSSKPQPEEEKQDGGGAPDYVR